MTTATLPKLYYQGRQLETSPTHFGTLQDSLDILHDGAALRQRMADNGYLYLPGILDIDKVLDARRSVMEKMDAEGLLHPGYPIMDGVAKPAKVFSFRPDLATGNPAVERLLYTSEMMAFFTRFLGGPVRHFDYTWMRAKAPGPNTATHPHCDIVYMSRGTHNLYTAWTPLGDVSYELGGLMVQEGSHRRADVLGDYWKFDVDTYCVGREVNNDGRSWAWDTTGGAFTLDAFHARDQLDGRWLTTEYQAGDLLVFCMTLLHASMDNQTDRIRLSTDSRYQLASEAVDERWIGEQPIAHGDNAKQAIIC